jgi:hypothetical protein
LAFPELLAGDFLRGERKMSVRKKNLIPILISSLLLYACAYIVVPDLEESSNPTPAASKGWAALVTNVGKSDAGDLHIDITIRNDTADWSAMQAVADHPAVLTASDGKNTNCGTVFVGTGGHRLAPGFQMRGYTGGTKAEPKTQLIYVECQGAEATPGSKLSIEISYVTGEFNYYYPDTNKVDTKLELNLDQIVTDLKYPIAEPIDGLILKPDFKITALSDIVITLTDIQRTDTGLQFTWQSFNPSDYALSARIGIPPVIGEDGIIYGFYQSPDRAIAPTSPAGDSAEWTTDVTIPQDVKGMYILMSVESKKLRLFVNYAIDITDK